MLDCATFLPVLCIFVTFFLVFLLLRAAQLVCEFYLVAVINLLATKCGKRSKRKQSEILPFLAALFNSMWLVYLYAGQPLRSPQRCALLCSGLYGWFCSDLDAMHIKRQGAFFAYLKALSKIAPYLGFRSFYQTHSMRITLTFAKL